MEQNKTRNSSVELLKISAILLIVLSHMIQTLCEKNIYIGFQDYILNLTMATTNPQTLALSILRYSGSLGNSIFFVCTAWFLLDSKRADTKKWWCMLLEVWFISAAILVIVYILRMGNIDVKLLIKSLFPTTFSTNWYMTCYLLFYLLHPVLNGIIDRMSQTSLLKSVTLLLVLYIGANFIKRRLFFSSTLILWISIYFGMAYMKLYLKDFTSNTKVNAGLIAAGLVGNIGLVLITNFLGLKIDFFADKLWHWYTVYNPFLILTAIALMNCTRKGKWQNAFVNHISKLSMLIYLIHENLILKTYYRPYLFNYIYNNFGYDYILLWILLLTLIIFLISVCASLFYERTLQKPVNVLAEKLSIQARKIYQMYESAVLKVH